MKIGVLVYKEARLYAGRLFASPRATVRRQATTTNGCAGAGKCLAGGDHRRKKDPFSTCRRLYAPPPLLAVHALDQAHRRE
jgi:hypothetical protein